MRFNLTPNRYLPLKIILLLDILCIAVFFAFVIWFAVTNGTGMETLRLELIILAFHAGAPVGLISALEHHGKKLPYLPVFWIWFAVVTDLRSVLEIQLHTTHIAGIVSDVFNALSALSIIFICLSGIAAVYYSVLIAMQMMEDNESGTAKKELKRTMTKDDSQERLLLRHAMK